MTPAEALQASQLFADLPADELRSLVEMCEPISLSPGSRLITRLLYRIRTGK